MVATSAAIDDRPSAFRYPRGDGVGMTIPDPALPLEIGKGRIVREGTQIAILSFGTRLGEALKAADRLGAQGFSTTVADARFAKPLDEELLLRLAREHEVLITVEEGAMGGFGAFVLHSLATHGALDRGLKVRTLTLPDIFQDHDKAGQGVFVAGQDVERIAEIAVGDGHARLDRDRLADQLDGDVRPAGLDTEDAEQVQGVEMAGFGSEHLLVALAGFVQTPRLMQGQALVADRLQSRAVRWLRLRHPDRPPRNYAGIVV